MILHRIGKKKFSIYAFDIESHNDIESLKKKETSMWLGSFINDENKVDDESSYFYNMEDFIHHIEKLTIQKRKNSNENRPCKNICIYIYNASFEWSFMLPILYDLGYVYDANVKGDKTFTSISTRSVSSVWEAKIRYSSDGGIILIRDLAKIFGGGLRKVAKSFNLPTQKGDIDYRLNRLHGHIVTKEEKEYCFKDTRIIIDIILEMIRRNDKAFFKSLSMASYSMIKMIKEGFKRSQKPMNEFRKKYPLLEKDESEFLRNSVSGGICYCPRAYQFVEINHKIIHIDAHSMHPSSAYHHNFPYGKGTYGIGEPQDKLNYMYCCHVKVSYDDVLLHSVIKLIGQDFTSEAELYLWDFEITTMKKAYVNLKIEYIDYYAYSYCVLPWRNYYKQCFNKRLEAKQEGDLFNVLYYKLLMNSSYGKLLEKPHYDSYENIIGEDGIITSNVHQKEMDMNDIKSYSAKYTYLPVGSCIPAYSRCCLIELALKIGYEYITYFDTDSIFFIDNEITRTRMNRYMNNKNFLGGWAIEEIIDNAKFSAPKRYKTQIDNKATFKMGGFNLNDKKRRKAELMKIAITSEDILEQIKLDYVEVNIDEDKYYVQRAFRCKGGTLIDLQEKEIKVQPKYKSIYEQNKNKVFN